MIKICISVSSHALDLPSPLSQTVTPSRTPSSVTYFMDGPYVPVPHAHRADEISVLTMGWVLTIKDVRKKMTRFPLPIPSVRRCPHLTNLPSPLWTSAFNIIHCTMVWQCNSWCC